MRSVLQKNETNPKIRSLKVQLKIRFTTNSRKEVPEIKLCGEWLKQLGFVPGMQVTIRSVGEMVLIKRVS